MKHPITLELASWTGSYDASKINSLHLKRILETPWYLLNLNFINSSKPRYDTRQPPSSQAKMQPPTLKQYDVMIYRELYPYPTEKHPASFYEFVEEYIVEEIRLENIRFYGNEEKRSIQQDAYYPGHDYSTTVARNRLGAFPGHKKLFSALDKLGMTPHEIHRVCHWEGTRSAKEGYELQSNTKVIDITLDGIKLPSPRKAPTVTHHHHQHHQHQQPEKVARKQLIDIDRPVRHTKVDYYSDRGIWSNSAGSTEDSIRDSEEGFRQALILSTVAARSAARSAARYGRPQPPSSITSHPNWNQWAHMAHRSGIVLPTASRHSQLLANMPAHVPYALPTPPPSALQAPITFSTQDASTQINHVRPHWSSLPMIHGNPPTTPPQRSAVMGSSYDTDVTTEVFIQHSPVNQRRNRTTTPP